jgi:hypothetical protein
VLGFNSWNVFACKVTEGLMRDTMDLFVSLGLRDAGCMLAQSPGHHHQSLTHCPPGTDVNATTTTTTIIIIATTTCHHHSRYRRHNHGDMSHAIATTSMSLLA